MQANYPGVQSSWKRILSIAKNTPDPAAIDREDKYEDDITDTQASTRMQCMSRALHNVFTITSQAEGYVAFIATMIHELDFKCPVSKTFLKHILDYSEIPTRSTIEKATNALLLYANTTDEKVNQCIIWSLLARKFAGNLAEAMWKDDIGTLLIGTIADPYVDYAEKLYALLALDSFALTGSVKKRILANPSRILSVLNKNLNKCQSHLSEFNQNQKMTPLMDSPNLTLASSLDRKYSGKKFYHYFLDTKINLLNKLKRKKKMSKPKLTTKRNSMNIPLSKMLRDDWSGLMQLQHCLQWSLDHIFDHSSKLIGARVQLAGVHFDNDQSTGQCKFDLCSLELRNDAFSLESARGNTSVKSGAWYYEVLLLTDGLIQVGWGTSKCLFLPQEGCGVGDDPNGFAFDTFRSAVWNSSNAVYPQGSEHSYRCKIGDVLGSLLDLENGICTFFINGQDYGWTVQLHTSAKKPSFKLYPMISLTNHQHVIVNFGDKPWFYTPPTDVEFKPVSENNFTQLRSEKKELENEVIAKEHDWDGPLCTLCFSEPKDTVLLPCNHDGFGRNCTNMLDLCPLCRTAIDKRKYVSS